MTERDRINTGCNGMTRLGEMEVLETRLAPMFMCCGHWSYTVSIGLSGPTLSVTWVEDGDAACNQA